MSQPNTNSSEAAANLARRTAAGDTEAAAYCVPMPSGDVVVEQIPVDQCICLERRYGECCFASTHLKPES